MTKKELIEALSNFNDDARITVSIDDGTGLQCDADIVKIKGLISPDIAVIIPATPVSVEYVDF